MRRKYKRQALRAILKGIRGIRLRKRRRTARQTGGTTVYSGKRRGLWF